MNDTVSRQWLMECVNEGWIKFDTEKDKNRFIHLVRDIAPSEQPEITEEQVREYCRKRGLSVVDRAWLAKYVNGCQDTISELPSAQPEIIRCRDCVYKPCKMMPYSYDDDFCSYAERREVSE